jgi:hypothetical protein
MSGSRSSTMKVLGGVGEGDGDRYFTFGLPPR